MDWGASADSTGSSGSSSSSSSSSWENQEEVEADDQEVTIGADGRVSRSFNLNVGAMLFGQEDVTGRAWEWGDEASKGDRCDECADECADENWARQPEGLASGVAVAEQEEEEASSSAKYGSSSGVTGLFSGKGSGQGSGSGSYYSSSEEYNRVPFVRLGKSERFVARVGVPKQPFLRNFVRVTVISHAHKSLSIPAGVSHRRTIPNFVVLGAIVLEFFQLSSLSFTTAVPLWVNDPFPSTARLFLLQVAVDRWVGFYFVVVVVVVAMV